MSGGNGGGAEVGVLLPAATSASGNSTDRTEILRCSLSNYGARTGCKSVEDNRPQRRSNTRNDSVLLPIASWQEPVLCSKTSSTYSGSKGRCSCCLLMVHWLCTNQATMAQVHIAEARAWRDWSRWKGSEQ